MAILNKNDDVLKQVWVREKDKIKFKKLAEDRKVELWEMFQKMLENYKEG